MRPLNTRERRIQFFRFLALFLLAVLPIVLLVWLHGRVDHVENDFLRSKYSKNKAQGEKAATYERKLIELETGASELRKFVVGKSGGMHKFKCEEQGELQDKVGALLANSDDFKLVATESDLNDSITLKLAGHYHTVANQLLSLYEKACADRELAAAELKNLQQKLTDAEKAQADAERLLDSYKRMP